MKTITIKNWRTGQTLYTGKATTMKRVVEKALAEGISLAYADLRHANLMNDMDGAILDDAQLDQANLIGANLAEASFKRTSLTNTQLHNAILCDALLDSADFTGALFGGTDISRATITHCRFDTLSTLDLNFRDARQIDTNIFTSSNGHLCRFSQPPLALKGLPFPLTFFDKAALVGHHALTELPTIKSSGMSSSLFTFVSGHRDLIDILWKSQSTGEIQAA